MLFKHLINPNFQSFSETDIDKPFHIRIFGAFIFMKIFIWLFFISFWVLLLIGIIASIITTIKDQSPLYFIPIFICFWFTFLWLFFYLWCWVCGGSNYPIEIEVNENGAIITYPIKMFNYQIPKDKLLIKVKKIFGVSVIYIKSKNRFKGIYLNHRMYNKVN